MEHKRLIACILLITALVICAMAPLRQGSSGSDVTALQKKLKRWGYYTGEIDGIFGTKTKEAVMYFQRTNGLTPDGVVGEATAKALGLNISGGSASSGQDSSLYLLAKCVYAEARGEPYAGKVAVAAVVLNRVKSADFPNSISGVIYQPLAFTAVADGQINLSPDTEAIRAARDAMNGWDPSGGALYYYNPAKTTSKWIYSRRVITVIGKHYFAV